MAAAAPSVLDRNGEPVPQFKARDIDRLALSMAPEHGLWLEFNGREVARINKPQFGRLYFGIWLGDPPLSASLRDALLPGDCCQAE